MSHIDVLAVIKEAEGFISASGDFDYYDLQEARAAVAEIITQRDLLAELLRDFIAPFEVEVVKGGVVERSRIVLARVTGGAA